MAAALGGGGLERVGSRAIELAETHAGGASSVLGIGGMALSFVPGAAPVAGALIGASVAAGAVDTAIQGWNLAHGGRNGATMCSTLYAATGMLPAASVAKLRHLVDLPRVSRLYQAGLLAANGGLIVGEVAVRAPRIAQGEAKPLDYLNLGAALTGVSR